MSLVRFFLSFRFWLFILRKWCRWMNVDCVLCKHGAHCSVDPFDIWIWRLLLRSGLVTFSSIQIVISHSILSAVFGFESLNQGHFFFLRFSFILFQIMDCKCRYKSKFDQNNTNMNASALFHFYMFTDSFVPLCSMFAKKK